MINTKPTVTVGIAAYNEDRNIEYLLKKLLSQNEANYVLKSIVVISDASSDNTDSIVKYIKDERVALIRNKTRKGQNYSQNYIFKIAESDIVVLFEADTCPKDGMYIMQLIEPIIGKQKFEYAQGVPEAIEARTIIEKILFHKIDIFNKLAKGNMSDDKLFISGLGGRAFSKKLYKRFKWPKNTPDDMYCFQWCKRNNIKICLQHAAICNFRLPQNLKDHLIKMNKVVNGENKLNKYFPKNKYAENYKVPSHIMIKYLLYLLFKNPLLFIAVSILKIIEKMYIHNKNFNFLLNNANSTKNLFRF